MFFENRPKWLQSNPHMPKVIPKCASDSTVIPKWPSARSLGAGFNSPVASLISNISHKNVYFLFMGPFGSDTRRQATPKLPQMIQSHAHIPQVTPKWPPNAPKMAPSWPQSYIKSLKSGIRPFLSFIIAHRPRSLEASSCLGGNREAKSIFNRCSTDSR